MSMLAGSLPGLLPAGEHILWQGRPCWRTLARRGFHSYTLSAYLAVLLTWYVFTVFTSHKVLQDATMTSIRMTGVAIIPLVLLLIYAWVCARSTSYTITNRRVIMKIGIAMPLAVNLPFAKIDAANVKLWASGYGEIAFTLPRGERMSYIVLWPHERPWRMAHLEPMLRCIPNAQFVGQILGSSLSAYAELHSPVAPDSMTRVGRLPVKAVA